MTNCEKLPSVDYICERVCKALISITEQECSDYGFGVECDLAQTYIDSKIKGDLMTNEDKDLLCQIVAECLYKALKSIKDECSNCKRCSTDCPFFVKYKGCTFCDIPPEYWDCEKITKGVIS